MKTAIGIDLGGTRIKAVALDAEGNVLHQLYKPTNDGDDTIWKNAVAVAVNELQNILKAGKINIGLSAPGLPNENNTAIAFMPGRMAGPGKSMLERTFESANLCIKRCSSIHDGGSKVWCCKK